MLVKLDKQPQDFLKKCDNIVHERIVSKLRELEENPVPHDAKRVHGYGVPTFRIRIGKWRALYRIDHEESLIVVVKIDNRDKVY